MFSCLGAGAVAGLNQHIPEINEITRIRDAFLWSNPDQDQGTEESTLGNDSSVPVRQHNPSDLGSLILIWIIPKERTHGLLVAVMRTGSSDQVLGARSRLFCDV